MSLNVGIYKCFTFGSEDSEDACLLIGWSTTLDPNRLDMLYIGGFAELLMLIQVCVSPDWTVSTSHLLQQHNIMTGLCVAQGDEMH